MIFLFYRLCKNQQFPQDGLFFGEKETLEESNDASPIKVRSTARDFTVLSWKHHICSVYNKYSPACLFVTKSKMNSVLNIIRKPGPKHECSAL